MSERDPSPPAGPSATALPLGARRRLAELAATALGDLSEAEVPASLRRVRSFAPARRARAAAGPLLVALDLDAVLRGHAALIWAKTYPEAATELPGLAAPGGAGGPDEDPTAEASDAEGSDSEGSDSEGPDVEAPDAEAPEAADRRAPADDEILLVGAFLVRPDGWEHLIDALLGRLAEQEAHRQARHAEAAARVRADTVAEELRRVRAELTHAEAQITLLTEEVAGLRREQRRLRADADRARAAARAAEQEAARSTEEATGRTAEAQARMQRAAERVAQAEEQLEQARRSAREGRSLADVRARLLLDTIVDAAAGLRRELALPPVTHRPADVAVPPAAPSTGPVPATPARALAGDDPALLDQLLALPQSHLIVDGYNVTKTGYGSLPLAEQRRRLVDALGMLAVRTASEVTCCFDGAEVDARGATRVRGVRVIFSEPGTTADELIRRLVRAEPPGRPVVVVSSDAEVAANSRASGARAVPSTALLRLLART